MFFKGLLYNRAFEMGLFAVSFFDHFHTDQVLSAPFLCMHSKSYNIESGIMEW